MRGSFWRFPASRLPARWRFLFQGACLGALGAACIFASGCGQASLAGSARAPLATARPTLAGPPTTCAALRQFLASKDEAPTPTAIPGGHWVYTMDVLGPLPLQASWSPGATMRVSFCADPTQTTADTQTRSERLTAQLLGPFKTMGAASQAAEKLSGSQSPDPLSTPAASAGPVAASAPALTTDSLAGSDLSTTLQTPATPTTGYYVFVARVVSPSGSSTDGADEGQTVAIIQVKAA